MASGPLETKIREMITRKTFEELSASGIAKELNKSLDHINRQLGEEGSDSLGQLIHLHRLVQCQHILRNSQKSIGEIGSAVGMDDQNYFARWFRRHTGQSPSRWREGAGASDDRRN